jgi:hypothetical protein
VSDTAPLQGAESTAHNLAETFHPLLFILGAAVPDGDIGKETGEPRAPPRPARESPLIHDTALIGPLVPNTYHARAILLLPERSYAVAERIFREGTVHSLAPQLRLACGAFFDGPP